MDSLHFFVKLCYQKTLLGQNCIAIWKQTTIFAVSTGRPNRRKTGANIKDRNGRKHNAADLQPRVQGSGYNHRVDRPRRLNWQGCPLVVKVT